MPSGEKGGAMPEGGAAGAAPHGDAANAVDGDAGGAASAGVLLHASEQLGACKKPTPAEVRKCFRIPVDKEHVVCWVREG